MASSTKVESERSAVPTEVGVDGAVPAAKTASYDDPADDEEVSLAELLLSLCYVVETDGNREKLPMRIFAL